VTERLAGDGSSASPSTPQEFITLIKTEIGKWKRLVKEAGLQLN
jgi:tripartite-type tricarboxylate transporter receptor subunit TctC